MRRTLNMRALAVLMAAALTIQGTVPAYATQGETVAVQNEVAGKQEVTQNVGETPILMPESTGIQSLSDNDADGFVALTKGQKVDVKLEKDETAYYKFTPQTSGVYRYYYSSESYYYPSEKLVYVNGDTAEDKEYLEAVEEDSNSCSQWLDYELTEGTTYYLEVSAGMLGADCTVVVKTPLELSYDSYKQVTFGEEEEISVDVVTSEGDVTYQWGYRDLETYETVVFEGATDSTYTLRGDDSLKEQYRCIVTDGVETQEAYITTEIRFKLIMNEMPYHFGKIGDTVNLSVTTEGGTDEMTYAWYTKGDSGSWQLMEGEVKSTLTLQLTADINNYYYCEIDDDGATEREHFYIQVAKPGSKAVKELKVVSEGYKMEVIYQGGSSNVSRSCSLQAVYEDGTTRMIASNDKECIEWQDIPDGTGLYKMYKAFYGAVIYLDYVSINAKEEQQVLKQGETVSCELESSSMNGYMFTAPEKGDYYLGFTNVSGKGKVMTKLMKGYDNKYITITGNCSSKVSLQEGETVYLALVSSREEAFACDFIIGTKAQAATAITLDESFDAYNAGVYKFTPERNGYYYPEIAYDGYYYLNFTMYNDTNVQIAEWNAKDGQSAIYLEAGKTYYMDLLHGGNGAVPITFKSFKYEDSANSAAGYIGENIHWSIDAQNLLTIEGSGVITSDLWYVRNDVTINKVVVKGNISAIADNVYMATADTTDVLLPVTLTDIGNYAFFEAPKLTSITYAGDVKLSRIGNNAFYRTAFLDNQKGEFAFFRDFLIEHIGTSAKITLPTNIKGLADLAFYYDENLKEVTIPGNVSDVAYRAFFYCTNLENVVIQEGVSKISEGAFEACDKLKTITVPASVKEVGNWSIGYEWGGDDAIKAKTLPTIICYQNSAAHKYAVSNGIPYQFAGSNSNQETGAKKGTVVTVGTSKYKVTDAGSVSYTGPTSKKAKKITIPKKVTINGKDYKVTAVADKAFKKQTKLTSVTIGANVTSIGASAFEGCSKLTKVTIGTGVKKIGKSAFKNCKKLGTITIKSTKLKSVGKNAFKGIKATAKIKVPKKKLSAYKKLLKGKGQGKKVKITK